MPVYQSHYEELLATYSNHHHAVELLRQHRPYFEKIPSIRRSRDSVITIPLPVVQVRCRIPQSELRSSDSPYELITLPCDLALLMCDPEWKIKTGVEILVYIHRPQEDFSHLVSRWRQTQVALSRGYTWEMPQQFQHIFNEGAEKMYPLFVLFEETSERIKRGLKGAFLPYVIQNVDIAAEERSETSGVAATPDAKPDAE
ncbi:hypothetical protein HRE53_04340 [Acaryochloris sp. 'Moss Beach']|uniref:hypothetical protein n=1 Tax=Acaryochloris sp. 'Moss Beach' TaxID=2740837 RepID=UPI001F248E21|nr:hypothetical protein [Acaryochloris sp. 'Moss Beach']UJB70349.1 hypothetical protein HRE53_04340 [Acaryochloris sp. 'Moss Beach']